MFRNCIEVSVLRRADGACIEVSVLRRADGAIILGNWLV